MVYTLIQFNLANDRNYGLEMLAQNVSTSYRLTLTPKVLRMMLQTGQVPIEFTAHAIYLVNESPFELVQMAIEEAATPAIPAATIRSNVAAWAKRWGSAQSVWRR